MNIVSTELIVGMEVHVELATQSKMFTRAPSPAHPEGYDAAPNTPTDPVVLALPGARSTAAYSFAQWNIKEAVDAVTRSACPRLDVCLISNVLVYCTDEPTADVLTALLTTHKVQCILVNERGAEQKMVEMLQRRGVVVVRLMDQSGGRDDRQLLFLLFFFLFKLKKEIKKSRAT